MYVRTYVCMYMYMYIYTYITAYTVLNSAGYDGTRVMREARDAVAGPLPGALAGNTPRRHRQLHNQALHTNAGMRFSLAREVCGL